MKEILENSFFITAISTLGSLMAVLTSVFTYWKKRNADKHLIQLMNSSIKTKTAFENWNKEIENTYKQVSNNLEHKTSDLIHEDLNMMITNMEIEKLRILFLKEQIENLARTLDDYEKKEVMESLHQGSVIGTKNYIENILERIDYKNLILTREAT